MVDLLRSATIILVSFALMFLFIIYFYNLIVDGSLIWTLWLQEVLIELKDSYHFILTFTK